MELGVNAVNIRTCSTRVVLAIWIPAGKDEFGFTKYDSAPLKNTAHYRSNFERTISDHLEDKLSACSTNQTTLAGMRIAGDLNPQDADLGLRKISYQFVYHPTMRHADVPLEIPGDGLILSNGLYLWSFDYRNRADLRGEELKSVVKEFLRDDFFGIHLNEVFHFSWPPSLPPRIDDYRGALTFYQLDLLFNGIFDSSNHPHYFLLQPVASDNKPPPSASRRRPEEPRLYTVQGLLESGALFALENTYSPLFDERKDFSYRGPGERPSMQSVPLANKHVPNIYIDFPRTATLLLSAQRDLHATQLLLSRLTFACMEQFLRVAVSFGTIHYRAGLDFCRAQLTSDALQLRVSKSSAEMLRPSLEKVEAGLAAIDAYSTVIAGKIPAFLFIKDLIEDLIEVSSPIGMNERQYAPSDGSMEWAYSKKTLREAILQYDRQIDTIQAGLKSVDRNLDAVRTDQIIAELVEARKLAEIESESPRVFFLQADNVFITRLTQIALILAAVQVYSAVGVWVMERVTATEGFWPSGFSIGKAFAAFGHWVIIGSVVIFYAVRLIRRPPREAGKEDKDKANRFQSHVFDYSFLREQLNGGSRRVMADIAAAMPPLSRDAEVLPAVSVSSFRETPSSGVERTKYTLESATAADRTNYLFHVEIDRRIAGSDEEYLRDIRMVIRVPLRSKVSFDYEEAARAVIVSTVKELALVGKSQDDISRFFLTNFGWKGVS